MKLSELPVGTKAFTQLGTRVLAVLSRRVDGYCVYVDAVPGWLEVAKFGDKQEEKVAEAIITRLFHPGFEIDLPYIL